MVPLFYVGTSLDFLCSNFYKRIQFSGKIGRNTKPYCHFSWMQVLFIDSERAFSCQNSTVVAFNLSVEAKVGFVTPQMFQWSIDVNHYPNKEVKGKSFTNF